MAFLGRKRPALAFGGRRVGIFPVLGPGGQNRRDFWGRRSRATFGRGVYRPAAAGLRIRATCSLSSPASVILEIGPTDGKPPRHQADDYRRFFVETVPKRYTFGTGTPRNWLDLAWLERAPKRGVLGQNSRRLSAQAPASPNDFGISEAVDCLRIRATCSSRRSGVTAGPERPVAPMKGKASQEGQFAREGPKAERALLRDQWRYAVQDISVGERVSGRLPAVSWGWVKPPRADNSFCF
jgi:hypothetical protein